MEYITLDINILENQHLCCAISDRKHQKGIENKKKWLADRLKEGHVFRKLDARGKIFIEYAPLEKAWAPVLGDNYLYIYCLWVSGKYKGHGHAQSLLQACISDAKAQNKSGICIISSKKKKPFLSDKRFLVKQGFIVADRAEPDYELLALSFDGSLPRFTDQAKSSHLDTPDLTIYYSPQCPYILYCLQEIQNYCQAHQIPLVLIPVDSLQKAKSVPGIFNNWALFFKGSFLTHQVLNANQLEKWLKMKT